MIIIPAAGEGRRFREAGYRGPKHLTPLNGKPMLDHVIENVRPLDPYGSVFVATRDNVGETTGAMMTLHRALVQARPRWDETLIIANCDQLLDLSDFSLMGRAIGHGVIFTFKSASPAHSYVTTDEAGRITGIVEKPTDPPSDQAVSGVYVFTNPFAITQAIKDCLAAQSQSAGGEQYLSLAIQRVIDQEYTLYAQDVPTAILGTPEDFQRFQTAYRIARSLP